MVDTSPYDDVFWPIFGTGLIIAFVTSTAAAWSRNLVLPLVLLPLGVIAFWATIFLGSDLGYRAWQGISDPPDEAFSDSAPAGLMILGWIPGGMFCVFVFAVNWLIRLPFFLKSKIQTQASSVLAEEPERETSGESQNPFR